MGVMNSLTGDDDEVAGHAGDGDQGGAVGAAVS